jgi:2-dehydro-3-deoxygalactonokinase
VVVRPLPTFLAVDWGTTNRRIFLIAEGQIEHTERDDCGVTATKDFAAEVAKIRARLGNFPMLLAGMVGSNIGWRSAPYVAAPAGISEVASSLLFIDDRTAIVPGLSTTTDTRHDVMRGEEVQLLGAAASGIVPGDALLVQPGTHCKWARMENGQVADFVTAMTGELFALLRKHSLLAGQLTCPVKLDDAFRAGLNEGFRRDLGTALFGIRAAKMLGLRADEDAASFASGILIGNDVAARLQESDHKKIYILADAELGGLYSAAVETQGRTACLIDSHAAFVAGAIAIRKYRSDPNR